ncbi:MAG: hypothetical protein KF705_05005 [Phycisphaeraceae bacterium]|nr:hypothetical protein [Phycisphaeraceae bacterium]
MSKHYALFESLEPRQLLASYLVDNIGDIVDGNYDPGQTTLREAIMLANSNPGPDSVTFHESLADGIITLSGSQLHISGELAINGLGADRLAVSGNSASRVFQILAGANVSISGLTITAGNAHDAGGILNGGTLTLTDTRVAGNNAHTGGGILNSGTLTLTRSTVSDNTARNAAGISSVRGTVTLYESAVSANAAGYQAGGIWIGTEAIVTLTSSTVSDNNAQDGGGIWSVGTLMLADSTVSGNDTRGGGGGIISAGTVTLIDSTVSGNYAYWGGGIYNSNVMSVINSTVSGNTGSTSGGGILNNQGTATLIGSTVSGNSSSRGGGINNSSYGILTLTNSTVSGNTANQAGGGIFDDAFATALTINKSTVSFNVRQGLYLERAFAALLQSTIVSSNSGGDIVGILAADSMNNLIQNAMKSGGLVNGVGGNVVGSNPLLEPLSFNGGSTQTHAILTDSPAIDAGSNPVGLSTDQRGFARTQGFATDIGAFELPADPTIGSLTSSGPSAARGHSFTLTANDVTDAGGTIARVDFYLDANNDGIADTVELIGSDTDPADGFSLAYTVPVDAPLGATSFLAIATDTDGFASDTAATSVAITGAVPSIGSLTSSGESVVRGQPITFTANAAADIDGSVARVDFYLDANNDGIADTGELIGSDTDPTDGFTLAYTVPAGATPGATPFLAIATDNDGLTSAVSAAIVTIIGAAPSIGAPAGAADDNDTHRVVSVNTLGHVLVFEQGWVLENLHEKTGAPYATSPAVLWADPKDGLIYVAATSASGLILFTRSSTGDWTLRNLSTETGATASPVGNLTHFISIGQKIVVIAGITEDGRIVAFKQSLTTASGGGPYFDFIDISADLESQGQTTPNLTGLTSYVPKWDTWHLAGVDTLGRIQSIWINTNNPAFTKWRTDNLSTITGAPAIYGQLAVTLTAWGGINITGIDSSGNMLTTWWIPRFGGHWAVSNLTTRYAGPQLIGGNLTAYTTPWGGINYVGLDAEGTIHVYWWIPRFGGQWAVSPLLPSGTPSVYVPTGALTSSCSTAGTLSVYGTDANGNVLRMGWQPGPGSAWTVEDLTSIAIEQ